MDRGGRKAAVRLATDIAISLNCRKRQATYISTSRWRVSGIAFGVNSVLWCVACFTLIFFSATWAKIGRLGDVVRSILSAQHACCL
jgi:hypothetical protein